MVGFGHQDVKPDGRWFEIRDGVDQAGQIVARPRPLANYCQRGFINFHDDHWLRSGLTR